MNKLPHFSFQSWMEDGKGSLKEERGSLLERELHFTQPLREEPSLREGFYCQEVKIEN